MVLNTPVDPMAALEEEMSKEQKGGNFAPFFFSIKAGQKALVRPLLNMNAYVAVHKHEVYNKATNTYEVKALCATDIDPRFVCQHCETAKTNKKLAADARFILPIFVHAVVDVKTGQAVTYKDQNEQEQPVSGVRLLEMKRSSSILRDLVAAYNEDDQHDITRNDFVIKREGEQLDTKYTVTPKAPKPFTPPAGVDIPEFDKAVVLLQYADACPFAVVDTDDTPAPLSTPTPAAPARSGGKVRNVPDF